MIEKDPALVPVVDEGNVLYLSGDAAEENVLIMAGIERARELVAVLAADTGNVFLVLTARQLNPEVAIFASAGHEESKAKFTLAGATIVENPYEIGALRMTQRILRPKEISFLDFALNNRHKDILMEEIPVSERSKIAMLC